jgi:hypothetical protein
VPTAWLRPMGTAASLLHSLSHEAGGSPCPVEAAAEARLDHLHEAQVPNCGWMRAQRPARRTMLSRPSRALAHYARLHLPADF